MIRIRPITAGEGGGIITSRTPLHRLFSVIGVVFLFSSLTPLHRLFSVIGVVFLFSSLLINFIFVEAETEAELDPVEEEAADDEGEETDEEEVDEVGVKETIDSTL